MLQEDRYGFIHLYNFCYIVVYSLCMKQQDTQPTTQDILEAIQDFSTHVDGQFEKVDKRFGQADNRFDGIEQRLAKVEATMVTKDYLDDKLGDLRGDLTILMRKEDTKMKALVAILHKRGVITEDDTKHILAMEPFPQLSL
jgi:hypothetical protein